MGKCSLLRKSTRSEQMVNKAICSEIYITNWCITNQWNETNRCISTDFRRFRSRQHSRCTCKFRLWRLRTLSSHHTADFDTHQSIARSNLLKRNADNIIYHWKSESHMSIHVISLSYLKKNNANYIRVQLFALPSSVHCINTAYWCFQFYAVSAFSISF